MTRAKRRRSAPRGRSDGRGWLLGFVSTGHLVIFGLCFLPFVTFSCGGRDVASQSAFEIARATVTVDPLLETQGATRRSRAEEELGGAAWFWIVPGAALLGGLASALAAWSRRGRPVALWGAFVLVLALAASFLVRFPLERRVAESRREARARLEAAGPPPATLDAALAASELWDTRRTGAFYTACGVALATLAAAAAASRGRR